MHITTSYDITEHEARPMHASNPTSYPAFLQNLVFVYCYERNVCPCRGANPGCSRYVHTAAAAAVLTAASTNHYRAPTMHMFSASAGGPGR